jgi:hypothetical protein
LLPLGAYLTEREKERHEKRLEIERLLIDFLIHAPNHTAAAGKLLLDISVGDLFEGN